MQKNDKIVMNNRQGSVVEEDVALPSGEHLIQLSFKEPLIDDITSELLGIVGYTIDISNQKRQEKIIIEEKEKAEVANRAKTIFIANMSHDMKTPLSGIVTSAEVIAHDKDARERDRQFASIISASGKQLESFFTSCLDLSKMDMQEWASQTSIFSIKKLVEEIKALYLPKAISNHLSFEINVDELLPLSVEGHRDSLYRVLLNLVGNAIKFTQQGGVTLSASLMNRIDDQHISVRFRVKDTGMGIPEDKHTAIFEKLYRIKPSYESQIEGSGIGLYIVDQYVKHMSGEITVESKVGEGSTFTVTLPLKVVSNAVELTTAMPVIEMPTPQTPISIKTSNPTETKNNIETQLAENLSRALLVEDNEMVQFVTKSLLNSVGFTVDIAGTGEDAVEKFEPDKYDVIYMDIGLPKMNGYQTAQAIRAKEKKLNAQTETTIIALTGHGAVDVQVFCSQSGMQGIMSKPLSLEQVEMIWKYFKEDSTISVPGLTLLTCDAPEPAVKEAIDIDETIKLIGSKDMAYNLMATLITDLKNQFLPQINALISENKADEIRFLLHRQLGTLAYVKAPRLEKKLVDVQAIIHKGTLINESIYQEIEQEVQRVIDGYDKIDLPVLQQTG